MCVHRQPTVWLATKPLHTALLIQSFLYSYFSQLFIYIRCVSTKYFGHYTHEHMYLVFNENKEIVRNSYCCPESYFFNIVFFTIGFFKNNK